MENAETSNSMPLPAQRSIQDKHISGMAMTIAHRSLPCHAELDQIVYRAMACRSKNAAPAGYSGYAIQSTQSCAKQDRGTTVSWAVLCRFTIINYRVNVQFVLFTGGVTTANSGATFQTPNYNIIAQSPVITNTVPNQPVQVNGLAFYR